MKILAALFNLFFISAVVSGQACDTNLFPDGVQYPDTYHHVASDLDSWAHYNTHDPSVYKDGEWYYMFSTDASWAGLNGTAAMERRSKDLVNWEYTGNAFDGIPSSAEEFFLTINEDYEDAGIWAPFVTKFKDDYILYFSAPGGLDNENLAFIGYATSSSAAGPWADSGMITKSVPDDTINAIDPTVIYDTVEKKLWMAYGSWYTGIYIVELDTNTYGLKTEGDRGKRIANRLNNYYGQEGPELVYRNGWYYLLMSYDGLGDLYNVRVGRSRTPDGPYLDVNGVDMTDKSDSEPMILGPYQFNNHPGWQGTGHCGVYNDEGKYYFFAQGRPSIIPEMMVLQTREIYWINDWPVLSPECYAGVPDCDVLTDSLVGEWEHMPLIYTNNTSVNYRSTSESLIIAADGTFNEESANTWTFDGDTLVLNWSTGEVDKLIVKWGWDWENENRTILYTGLTTNYEGTSSTPKCLWGKKIYPEKVANFSTIEEGGTYIIRSSLSHLLVTASGNTDGATVYQWGDKTTKDQLWKIKSAGDDYYYLLPQNCGDTMALEVKGGSSSDGSDIIISKIDGLNRQKFKLNYHNNGLYRITSMVSSNSSAFDVYGYSIENGGNVNQWTYEGGMNQLWRITRLDTIPIDEVSIDTFPDEDPVEEELTIVNEPFDYDLGALDGNGSSGNGWGGSWSISGVSDSVQIVAGLTYSGLSTTGNSLEIKAQDGSGMEATRELSSTWADVDGSVYWFSALFQVENPSDISDSWQGISLDNGSEQAYIGKLWGMEYLGINDPDPYLNTASETTWDNGIVYLVVKMVMSGDDNVDTTYMWINADPTMEPAVSDADVVADITLNNGFKAIRCHLGQTAGLILKIDELRLSDSWSGLSGESSSVQTVSDVIGNVKAYPNPFTDQVTLEYELTSAQDVKIEFMSVDGRVIDIIREFNVEPGIHCYTWDSGNRSNGIFFYRIILDNNVVSGRLIHE